MNYSTTEKSILIIEDHEAMRLLLGLSFNNNFTTTTLPDPIAGLAWLSKGNIPDLIILDLELPKLSGYKFLQQLRTSGSFNRIPVLIVSSLVDDSNFEYLMELGIAGVVQKPFNMVKLKDKVSSLLLGSSVSMAS